MRKKLISIDQETMAIKKVFDLRFPFWTSLALNLVTVSVIAFILLKEKSILTKYKTMIVEKLVEDIPLTDSAIINELTHLGCVQVPVALAQFKIETGHFTSHICKDNKNIAGIRTSKSKFVIGMKNDHCAYATYRDCLRDYVIIQNRYLININHRYAEDPSYISKLKQIK